jgi:hypothetical protein
VLAARGERAAARAYLDEAMSAFEAAGTPARAAAARAQARTLVAQGRWLDGLLLVGLVAIRPRLPRP